MKNIVYLCQVFYLYKQSGANMDFESALKYSRLLDFYGNLLTDRQKEIATLFFYENNGLSEIADFYGLSRQSVYDILKRVKSTLSEYESKLGLYEKYSESKKFLSKVVGETDLNGFIKIWES